MKVLSIVGTRPEAIKMAPVIQELSSYPGVESRVCVTAQHRQMLDQVFNLFQIKPDVDLNLMKANQSLAELTAAIFTHLDPVLTQMKPDWVLAQGDTTTVMATSLLAYYHRIRFGHVEAGLRTFDKWQPFPEEINRRVAGLVADLNFAPTAWARNNLLKENVAEETIVVTGNPVIDALRQVATRPPDQMTFELLTRLGLHEGRRLVLVTAHRRENFGQPLVNICQALLQLADIYGDAMRILYPVHLNPNVRNTVYPLLDHHPGIVLTQPLDYLPMVHMLKRAALVLTDSGGLQEEAPGLGVPVLVMREVTERPEGVQAGTVRLIGTEQNNIRDEVKRLLDNPGAYEQMARAVNPYGDGKAAQRIINALIGKMN
jgi:UDP-N-acetylglucosamine 2-epimerase (non-hydrolysing)